MKKIFMFCMMVFLIFNGSRSIECSNLPTINLVKKYNLAETTRIELAWNGAQTKPVPPIEVRKENIASLLSTLKNVQYQKLSKELMDSRYHGGDYRIYFHTPEEIIWFGLVIREKYIIAENYLCLADDFVNIIKKYL